MIQSAQTIFLILLSWLFIIFLLIVYAVLHVLEPLPFGGECGFSCSYLLVFLSLYT